MLDTELTPRSNDRRSRLGNGVDAMLASICFAFVSINTAGADVEKKDTPRTLIFCAYEPEWNALLPAITEQEKTTHVGMTFVTGRIAKMPILLIEGGISMVNATMAIQAAIERYDVERVVVMGISGGADPGLHIGDVVIPDQWRQYFESIFAREEDGRFVLPDWAVTQSEHFGMIFPQPVEVPRDAGGAELRAWFPVDARLMGAAHSISSDTKLDGCTAVGACLPKIPRLVVGGNGVSGPAFVDNSAFRLFARQVFQAEAIDMETAAAAQVAYMNGLPFLAVRGLSDLAGGGTGPDAMKSFQSLAAENAVTVLEKLLERVDAN